MTSQESDHAQTLRRDFDTSFAAPVAPPPEAGEALLAIRVGNEPYALRLAEIVALRRGLTITPVPTRSRSLLGIAGWRGMLKAVHDLGAALGGAAQDHPDWLIFPRAAPDLGLAFTALDAHVRVAASELQNIRAEPGRVESGRVELTGVAARALVRIGAALCPVIHLETIVQTLKDDAS